MSLSFCFNFISRVRASRTSHNSVSSATYARDHSRVTQSVWSPGCLLSTVEEA